MAMPTLRLGEYTLRPVEERDEAQARAWTQADPFHQHLAPEFWREAGNGLECYALENKDGCVVLFFRVEKAARCFVQFDPEAKHETRRQNAEALQQGVHFLGMALACLGYQEMLFDTVNPPLKSFSEKRLGFRSEPSTLTKRLPATGQKR